MLLKHKGFSLVELLAVIIILAILAGSLLISAGAASDSARASTLISELRNAKAAGSFWFYDNSASRDSEFLSAWNNTQMVPVFQNYLDNPIKAAQLFFEAPNWIEGRVFLIGKSADQKVIAKAIRQGGGALVRLNGTNSQANDSDVFIRVR